MKKIKSQFQLSEELKKEAISQGFNPVGIACLPSSERIKLRTAALQRWLNKGYQADMKWMSAPRRQNIESLLEGVNSVLSVGLNYYVNKEREPFALSIARYAWGQDYHKIITRRLKRVGNWLKKERPNCQWKICVDSSALMDKVWAEEAGIGWIGKNSNLINKKYGSWFVIGHLLCTEKLIADKPYESLCGKCEKCIKACPTNAITEPFVVNSNLCLAYHTIENRNANLPKEISSSLGTWIAGCDICQEECPWNQKELPSSSDPEVQPQKRVLSLTQKQAIAWSESKWKKQLQGSALKRIKPWMWKRNAESIKNVIS